MTNQSNISKTCLRCGATRADIKREKLRYCFRLGQVYDKHIFSRAHAKRYSLLDIRPAKQKTAL